jgi:hypothetical protein
MPDPTRRRPTGLTLALLAPFVLLALGAPVVALAGVDHGVGGQAAGRGDRVVALAPPVETCAAQETRAAGDFNICSPEISDGNAGVNLGALLPIVGIVAVGGVVALLAAFFVLRRTAAPLVPADPGEWWTCRSCGKTNVLGSARCYACGTWQR